MTKIYLKKGRDESVRRFHPWVFSGAVAQTVGMLAFGAFAEGFAYVPEFVVVGVRGIASLVAAVEHLVAHPQRVAYAQHMYSAPHQLLADPVHGGVARCAH